MMPRHDNSGKSRIKSLKSIFKLFFEKHVLQREFFRNKIVLWLLAFSFLFNILNWIFISIFINHLDGDIILHYNVYFGVDSLGDWRRVFILPIIGLILLALNAFLADYFYRNKERIASYVLLITALMAQLNLIIAAASVVMINY